MSSLLKQLENFKVQERTYGQHFKDNERPSVLFEFKDAASYSNLQIKDLAKEGFSKMSSYLPQLQKFELFLFSEENDNLDRKQLPAEENDQIGQKFEKILMILSQHLPNVNALKVMEYLLRNYDVHEYESEKLIVFFLHFHNLPIYVKLLQNINLRDQHKWYHNLDAPVKEGKLIDRRTLEDYFKHSFFLFDHILKFNIDYLCYHKVYQTSASYIVTSSAQKNEQEFPSFRFFSIFLLDFLEKNKTDMNMLFKAKTFSFQILQQLVEHQETAFLQGFILLAIYLIVNKVYDHQESSLIFSQMIKLNASDSQQQSIIKFLLLICKQNKFELSIKHIQIFVEKFKENVLSTFKYFDPTFFIMKILLCTKQHLKVLTKNQIASLITALETALKNYNFDKQQNIDLVFDLIAEIFVEASLEQNQSLVPFFKSLKEYVEEKVASLIERKYEVLNVHLESSEQQVAMKLRNNFRALIKSVYGPIYQYGLDEELQAQNQRSVLLFNFLQSEGKRRVIFLNKLKKQFNNLDSEVKKKTASSLVLVLSETNQLEEFIQVFVAGQSFLSGEQQAAGIEAYLQSLIQKNTILSSSQIQLFHQSLSFEHFENPFLILLSKMLFSNWKALNNHESEGILKEITPLTFQLDLENLMSLLNYVLGYQNLREVSQQLIEKIVLSPLKMKITPKNIESFTNMLEKSLQILVIKKGMQNSQFKELLAEISEKVQIELFKLINKIQRTQSINILKVLTNFCFREQTQLQYSQSIFDFIKNSLTVSTLTQEESILKYYNSTYQNLSVDFDENYFHNVLFLNILQFKQQQKNNELLNHLRIVSLERRKGNSANDFFSKCSNILISQSQELQGEQNKVVFQKLKKYISSLGQSEGKESTQLNDFIKNLISQENISSLYIATMLLNFQRDQQLVSVMQSVKSKLNSLQDKENPLLIGTVHLIIKIFMRKQEWQKYLEFLNQWVSFLEVKSFVEENHKPFNESPLYIKLLTLLRFRQEGHNIFQFSYFKIQIEELVLFYSVIKSNASADEVQFITMNLKSISQGTKVDSDSVYYLFIMLACSVENLGLNSGLVKEIISQLNEVQHMIKFSDEQNCFKKQLEDQFEDDLFNTNRNTLQKFYNCDAFQNTFVVKKKKFCIVKIERFLNENIQSQMMEMGKKNFTLIDEQSNQEEDQTTQNYLHTIIHYLLLFYKFSQEQCQLFLTNILQKQCQTVLTFKEDLIKHYKLNTSDKNDFYERFDSLDEEQKQILHKVEMIEESMVSVFRKVISYFRNSKIKNKFTISTKILHIYFCFLDESLRGGIQRVLSKLTDEKYSQKYQILQSSSYKALESILSQDLQGDFKVYAFSSLSYFIESIQKGNVKAFIELLLNMFQTQTLQNNGDYVALFLQETHQITRFLNIVSSLQQDSASNPEDSLQQMMYMVESSKKSSFKRQIQFLYSQMLSNLIQDDIFIRKFIKISKSNEVESNQSLIALQQNILIEGLLYVKSMKTLHSAQKIPQNIDKLIFRESLNIKKFFANFQLQSLLLIVNKILVQHERKNEVEKIQVPILQLLHEKMRNTQMNKNLAPEMQGLVSTLVQVMQESSKTEKKNSVLNEVFQIFLLMSQVKPDALKHIENSDKIMIQQILETILKQKNPVVVSKGFEVIFDNLNVKLKPHLKIMNQLIKEFFSFATNNLTQKDKHKRKMAAEFCGKNFISEIQFAEIKDLEGFQSEIQRLVVILLKKSGNFIQPHLNLLYSSIYFLDEKVASQVINAVQTSLDQRIIMDSVLDTELPLEDKNFSTMFLNLLNGSLRQLESDSFVDKQKEIFDFLLSFLDRNLGKQVKISVLEEETLKLIGCFAQFSLKCNRDQLKSYFVKLQKWSKIDNTPLKLKQSVLIAIQNEIVEKFGPLGVFLYEETIEQLLDQLQFLASKEKLLPLQMASLEIFLKSLNLLFLNDKENFLEMNIKEQVCQILNSVLGINFSNFKSIVLVGEFVLLKAFSSLPNVLIDEVQIRNLIMQLYKSYYTPDEGKRLLTVKSLQHFIKGLSGRGILFINTLVPIVGEIMNDTNIDITQEGRRLLDILQEQTEDNLEDIIKEQYDDVNQ